MLGRALVAFIGLLALPCLSWPASGEDAAPLLHDVIRAGEHRVPFQLRDGLIYIQGQVNGKRATLLVDTGAALTTFTLRVVPTLNTDATITMNLAKGSVLASRLPVGFVLGDSNLREQHCSFHQNAVVGNFKFLDADGLIGQDVLSHFRSITLDFKNSTLILEDR
jgi:predicted aspartyl protease